MLLNQGKATREHLDCNACAASFVGYVKKNKALTKRQPKARQLFSQPELKRLEAEYAQLSPGHGYAALAKELAKELSLDLVRITYAPSTHCATGEVLTCPNLCARCLDHYRGWFANKRQQKNKKQYTDRQKNKNNKRSMPETTDEHKKKRPRQ